MHKAKVYNTLCSHEDFPLPTVSTIPRGTLYIPDIDDESFFYILDRPCFLPTFQQGKERLTAARRVNLVNGLNFQNKFHRYISFLISGKSSQFNENEE
jgi:hypothetical protein